jgi:iron-sulfur cluster assembly protein
MISLTDLAARKISQQLERRGKGLGIRIGVKTTGCSGYAYKLEYVDTPSTEDMSFVSQGIHVFVDPKSLVFVDGLVMDWKRNGLNEGFDFVNPNEKDRCGCGESFRI